MITASTSAHVTLAIRDTTVVTMDDANRILRHATILVSGNRIAAVVDDAQPAVVPNGTEVIDGRTFVAIPGLINAHAHAAELLMRGRRANRSLYDWQWNVTYPGLRRYSYDDVYAACLLFAVEALRSGTTLIVDNSNLTFDPSLVDASIRAFSTVGIRAIVAPVLAAAPVPAPSLVAYARSVQNGDLLLPPESVLNNLDDFVAVMRALMARYNTNTNSLIRVWPAPHKPNRTSLVSIQRCYELVAEFGGRVSQPCAEIEAEAVVAGIPSIEYLATHGVLNRSTLLAHCVYIGKHSFGLIRDAAAAVVHLPVANLYLASGVAPVPQLLRSGITVALGTDNANCNDTANMLREITFASLIHNGVTREPESVTALQAFRMATRDGARAIGDGDVSGSVEVGKQADLVLLRADTVELTPMRDVISTIAHQTTAIPVETVIVDGRVVLRNGLPTCLSASGLRELVQHVQARAVELDTRLER